MRKRDLRDRLSSYMCHFEKRALQNMRQPALERRQIAQISWWVEMCSMSVATWYFPHKAVFERVRDGQWLEIKQLSFWPIACRLDGRLPRP